MGTVNTQTPGLQSLRHLKCFLITLAITVICACYVITTSSMTSCCQSLPKHMPPLYTPSPVSAPPMTSLNEYTPSSKYRSEESVRRKAMSPSTKTNDYSVPNFSRCLTGQREVCKTGNHTGQCLRNIYLKNTYTCRHLMSLKHVNFGRTGNQLFQVAALLNIARYHGYTPMLHNTMTVLDIFDLPNVVDFRRTRRTFKTFKLEKCCTYDARVKQLEHTSNWTLFGYYQSWKFFEGSEDLVRKTFKIKDRFATQARKLINMTAPKNTQTVCIHVRRGDFTIEGFNESGFTMAPLGYIKNAVGYFKSKYERVHFYVVSDDIAWCISNLSWPDMTFSPFKKAGYDMALLMTSDHVIVTSGTFGWWGGWLCGGDVVYWTGYPGHGTGLGNQTDYDGFYPKHWIGLT